MPEKSLAEEGLAPKRKPFSLYPLYRVDRDAKCYACAGQLSKHRDSGFAPGSGARQADCVSCKHLIFYDLEETEGKAV